MVQPGPPSKSQIDRAGNVLRRHALGEPVSPGEVARCLELVRDFRAAHGYPLANVRSGLVHHARKAVGGTGWFDLSQRLKQQATIVDKLVRFPKTNLARMQDVAGCRVVLTDQEAVDRAIGSLVARNHKTGARHWDIVKIDDYVLNQRSDGYRAKHVIVRKLGRLIEIQFRTRTQHNWAGLVEDLDKATNLGLKTGRADRWAIESVAAASDDMRRYELGEIDREQLMRLLNTSLAPILNAAAEPKVIR